MLAMLDRPETDAVEILRRDLLGNDSERLMEYEQVRSAMVMAHNLTWLREAVGLSPRQLAAKAGYPLDVILAAEEGDYESDLNELMRRVKMAVNSF